MAKAKRKRKAKRTAKSKRMGSAAAKAVRRTGADALDAVIATPATTRPKVSTDRLVVLNVRLREDQADALGRIAAARAAKARRRRMDASAVLREILDASGDVLRQLEREAKR
jgi:hypothetical protein